MIVTSSARSSRGALLRVAGSRRAFTAATATARTTTPFQALGSLRPTKRPLAIASTTSSPIRALSSQTAGGRARADSAIGPQVSRGTSKLYKDADAAIADLTSGSTLLSAGFGVCGVPGKISTAAVKSSKFVPVTRANLHSHQKRSSKPLRDGERTRYTRLQQFRIMLEQATTGSRCWLKVARSAA